MLMILSLVSSVASAIILVGDPAWSSVERERAACEPSLVADTTRFVVAQYYGNNGDPSLVEIREKKGDGGIEVVDYGHKLRQKYEPSRVSDGPRVYLSRTPILNVKGISWEWAANMRPNHFGRAAWGLWTHYFPALEKLTHRNQKATVEELLRSELHAFWWKDKVAYLVRLPARDPSLDDRYRPMWLFANDTMEPIPIGRAVDQLKLNGEIFRVNDFRVYRFEDGDGVLRYVFEANTNTT